MMIVPQLWREAARFPGTLARSVGLLVLVLLTHVGQAVAIAWAMSAVLGGRPREVLAAAALVIGTALLRLVLSLAQTSAAARLGGRVRQAVRGRAVESVLTARRLHDTSARDGSMRSALGDGVDGTDAYVSKYIPAVAQILIACPLVVTGLFLLSPAAGLVISAGVVLALAGPLAWKRMMARRGLDHWDSYEALGADLLESLRGMSTLRALGDVPGTRHRLDTRSEALRRATERVMRGSLAETAVTDLAVQAGVVAAAVAATAHAVTGQAPAIEVYLVLLLSSEAFRPVRDLSRHWHAGFLGLSAVPALDRIGAFTETPGPADGSGHPTGHAVRTGAAETGERPPGSSTADVLRVTGVTFRYPEAREDVLDRFDLTARRGTLTAVVGASGAGKSTLFDLLLGFLVPREGRIELDGRPLRPTDIAVLSQRPVLFAGTVRDNLTVTGPATEAELTAACGAAGILDEVLALPHGLDTEVAEAGANLSGGQRQRLALARALLARRPVLLVDEPTSALDDDRAADVVATLHRVARDRVVVMISHRPETLSEVSHVLHLASGHLDGSLS
ncbi:ABC transporter ATP-binding protein/permease [Nocardiopsis ganjiahuensis]|uniref:ABC transporter ATP-binding protein/permease n=1 Tax=Nocardiopsis ganjiahuensis TaxID=239984 RepID=UPI00034A9642|nr:ATP-binding cassette domain-containing protein [Nocardiopsis ganjiahuensis]